MIEIKDLLEKFGNILLKEELKKEAVREVIAKAINFPIKKEDIKIKKGIIYLNIKPIYKNEIFLKKDQILKELEEALGQKSPQKII
jgi:hypothetical protein